MAFTGRLLAAALTALVLAPAVTRAATSTPVDVALRDTSSLLRLSQAAVDAYQGSSTHRALQFQYALGGDVPFRNAPWVGTHNSFNSMAEIGPTLSTLDSNQRLSLPDQLAVDVRSLELDVHWFRSVTTGVAKTPVVCHAQGNHVGCSLERTLPSVLDEIAGWLRGHPGQDAAAVRRGPLQRPDGRWESSDCAAPHRVACRAADGTWSVPAAPVAETAAAGACPAGTAFAAPRTGYENELVKAAAAGEPVWLADVRAGAGGHALDAR